MFKYPWGDFHSLNLGWFLVQFKEWTEKIQEYLDNGGGTSENLANVIAPVFNAENSYLTGDYVLYNDKLYKANQAVNPGTWDPDAWTRCLVTEEMGSGSGGVDNVARLMIAGQYSNIYNYQKYAICRYNDKLWMCNTNLPAGGEEWEPSHWDEITVGAGLTGLRRSVETLANAITELQNIVGDGTLSGFTATNLTGATNELKGSVTNIEQNLNQLDVQTTPPSNITVSPNAATDLATLQLTPGKWLITAYHEWRTSFQTEYLDNVDIFSGASYIKRVAIVRNLNGKSGGGACLSGIAVINGNYTAKYQTMQFSESDVVASDINLNAVKLSD